MREQNLVDRDRPSMRALAERAGLAVETVRRTIYGERDADQETLDAMADALGRDKTEVYRWANRARSVERPYVAPVEADRLNDKQRKALDQLIRTIVEAQPEPAAAAVEVLEDSPRRQSVRGRAGGVTAGRSPHRKT